MPAFAEAGPRRWIALALAGALIALDLTVFVNQDLANGPLRPLLALGVLCAYLCLGGGARAIGFRLRPVSGMGFWSKIFLVYALACLALVSLVALLVWWRDLPMEGIFESEEDIWRFAVGACLHAPITEELIYRLVLCAPLVALIGRIPTILVSAIVFSYLHMVWGKFEISHPIAGVILAWAYLRSGCLWVPMFIHALNNLFGLALYSYLFYYR